MKKILIIDDSNLSRRILKKILSEADFQVIEADNGLVGLELYMMEKPDVVILDLTMPGLSGFEILKKIIEIDQNAKVIIGTADIQSSTKKMALEYGAREFVNKPFIGDEVLASIKKILES